MNETTTTMAGITIDLDALLAGSNDVEPIRVRFLGRDFLLPGSAPVSLAALFTDRCAKQVGDQVLFVIPDDATYFALASHGLGRELFEAIKSSQLPLTVLTRDLLRPLFVAWGLLDPSVVAAHEEGT